MEHVNPLPTVPLLYFNFWPVTNPCSNKVIELSAVDPSGGIAWSKRTDSSAALTTTLVVVPIPVTLTTWTVVPIPIDPKGSKQSFYSS